MMPRSLCTGTALRRLLAGTTALSLLLPFQAQASDLVFSGPGNDWFSATNWTTGTLPSITDKAIIEGSTEVLLFGQSTSIDTLAVGENADGQLLIRDPLHSREATAGENAAGTVTASGTLGQWTNRGAMTFGDTGDGTLSILAGGTVSSQTLTLGAGIGGAGTLTLSGNGSRLDLSGALTAGYAGTGDVSLSAGAWLASGGARFGVLSGSNASLAVDRAGTTFKSKFLNLGEEGSASLAVTAGGLVDLSGDAILGQDATGTGTATIRGDGSRLAVSGMLTVGLAGNGTLAVSEGGQVESANARIGAAAGSSGTVTLSGLGSRWVVTDHLDLGSGALSMTSSATLSTGSATIGALAGETASASLSGSGTEWTNNGTLAVGSAGTGNLTVTSGASVQSGSVAVGDGSSGSGAVRVEGSGSQLSVSGAFDVGRLGNGTLAVVQGASASAASMTLGDKAGSTGSTTVDGNGSSLAVSGNFDIGRFGTGTLTVSGGATVSAKAITIAAKAGSTGTLNVGADEASLAAGAGALDTAAIYFGEGDGSLIFNHGETNYELSAAISGTGTVEAVRGTTVLTRDNTYDGKTTISSGATLAVGNGGTSGTLGSGSVSNNGSLVFNRAGEMAFSGAISGTGTLTKTGSGTLTLSGNSTYTGATDVDNGRLDIDGAITSAIRVATGATLGGSGSADNTTVESGGTLVAEGLSISGDLTLDAGSTLAARIGTSGIEAVDVTGTASIAGSRLDLGYEAGGALANHYTLLEATTVSGPFSSVAASGLSSRFTISQSIDSDSADIALVYDPSSAVLSGASVQGVHNILADAFNSGQVLSGSLSTALASGDGTQQAAMTALAGEDGTGARLMGLIALDDFLAATRQAGAAFRGNEGDSTVWGRLTGNSFAFDGDAGEGISAARIHQASAEGGVLFACDPAWTGGVALSFGESHYDSRTTESSATARFAQISAHATGQFSNGFYVASSIGLGMAHTQTARAPGSGDRVKGDFTTPGAGADFEAGQKIDFGDFSLTPFVGASFVFNRAPAYQEHAVSGSGTPALSYSALDQWNATTRIGFQADHRTRLGDQTVSFYTRLAYLYRFAGANDVQASFVSLPGRYFDLESLTREGGALRVDAGAALAIGPRTEVNFNVSGEWGADQHSVTGRLGLSMKW